MADEEQPAKRRRLGQRQRLNLIRNPPAQVQPNSALADFLISQWSWGHISPQFVQEVASKAVDDMQGLQAVPEPLKQLAALGGGYKNKMSGALIALTQSKVCKGFPAQLPYKKKSVLQKMLLPHEMFANLYAEYGEAFQKVLVGPTGELAKFWKSAKEHPALAGHPHLGNLSKTVPIGVHGDGVPITGKGKIWVRTAWVYSWSSLISQAPTKEKQLFIGMVWDTLQGPNTMNDFLQILSWSLKHLQLGMWPLEDWQGNKQLVYT